MDDSGLVCYDAIRGFEHIGRNVYWCRPPSRGSLLIDRFLPFLFDHNAESGIYRTHYYFTMYYIRTFVSTAWDLYFLLKEYDYKSKSVADISLDIKGHLESFFTQHGKECPDISEMVKQLKFTQLKSEKYWDCPQKDEFVETFSEIFSRQKMSTPKSVPIAMNDTVDIKYKGQYEPLKKYVLKISPELVTDGRIYSIAQPDIENAMSYEISEYDSLELPENLWEIIQLDNREFLLYWEVVMKPR